MPPAGVNLTDWVLTDFSNGVLPSPGAEPVADTQSEDGRDLSSSREGEPIVLRNVAMPNSVPSAWGVLVGGHDIPKDFSFPHRGEPRACAIACR